MTEISFDYLMLWGWNRRMVELNERLLRKLDDSHLRSIILTNQGHAYHDLGQATQAIRYHEQALAINRATGNRRGEGVNLGNLGLCYTLWARPIAPSNSTIRLWLSRARAATNATSRPPSANLGVAYATLGQVERAIGYCERAMEIDRRIGDQRGQAIDLGILGRCYNVLGQTARAINYHEQSLAIFREISDRRERRDHSRQLVLLLLEPGPDGPRQRLLRMGPGHRREVGDRVGEGNALLNLARRSIVEGRYEDAIRQAMDAVRIGGETGIPMIISAGNENLALARIGVGDLPGARAAAMAAREHNAPRNNQTS